MNFKNKTAQKIISCLIIISILTPTVFLSFKVKKTEAQFGGVVVDIVDAVPTVVKFVEEHLLEIIKQFLMTVARKLIDKMTQSTLNWINSGFHGAPLFIENPGSFFHDIAKEQLQGFINEIGYDPARFPFSRSYLSGAIDMARSTFTQQAQYSLSKIYTDPIELTYQRDNFSAGGWNGLLLNTQFPQNNFLGFDIMAKNELQTRLVGPASEIQKVKDKVLQGAGFLSQEDCQSNPSWDPDKLDDGPPEVEFNPQPGMSQYQNELLYNSQVQTAQLAWETTYGCPEGPRNVTPGSLAADSVMNALGSKQRQGELGAALGNSLAVLFDALINKLFGMGVQALSNIGGNSNNNTPTPDPSYTFIEDFNVYGDATGTVPLLGGPPAPNEPHLTNTITVTNDNGGLLYDPTSLVVRVDGITSRFNAPVNFPAGTHTVSLDQQAGYDTIYTKDCDRDGIVHMIIPEGQYQCHIILNDLYTGNDGWSFIVNVIVINNDLGTASADKIEPLVNGNVVQSGVPYKYPPGTYHISEVIPDGYTVTYEGDCLADGTIIVTAGSSWTHTCNIVNNDITGWFLAKLQINTVVVNDAPTPGTLQASSVRLFVNGQTTNSPVQPTQTITSGTILQYVAGNGAGQNPQPPPITYKVSGTTVAGYNVTFTGDCDDNGEVELIHTINDAVKVCTITYDDQ